MRIRGTTGIDNLTGTRHADEIFALDGNDFIMGGRGRDHIDGGPGTDWVSYVDSPVGVFVSLLDGTGSGGTAQGDTLVSIEILAGSNHNDILFGDNNENFLYGLDGDDSLFGLGGDDHLIGGRGNDLLAGGAGADHLSGGLGIDTASYEESPDRVEVSLERDGEDGHGTGGTADGDTLVGIENLIGSLHDDQLRGNAGANRLEGLAGDDILFGFQGADHLLGGRGADILIGGMGADHLDGGAGDNDTAAYTDSLVGVDVNLEVGLGFSGTALGDVLERIENLIGSDRADVLVGDGGTNVLEGGRGPDQLVGGGGDDHLFGGRERTPSVGDPTGDPIGDPIFVPTPPDGNDTLTGGRGADRLDGGTGADELTGGRDADTFVWMSVRDTGVTPDTWDTITDFNRGQGDLIDLTVIDADETTPGHQDFTAASFIGDASGGFPAPGQIGFNQSDGDTFIIINTNGDAAGDAVIHLMGTYTPDWSWFVHV